MNASDIELQARDLSLIYREIYFLAVETCHLSRTQAENLASWYCSTGGHVDEPDFGAN